MTELINKTGTKTILVSIVVMLIPIMFYFHYFESQTTVPKHIIALNSTYLQSDVEINYLATNKVEQDEQLDHDKWQDMKTKLQAIRMHNTLRNTVRHPLRHSSKNASMKGINSRYRHTIVVNNKVLVEHDNPRLWTLTVR